VLLVHQVYRSQCQAVDELLLATQHSATLKERIKLYNISFARLFSALDAGWCGLCLI
jgi:hypothetical protein